MIKKILSIHGIGRFEKLKATGDVTFGKYTLIFAENGVGKTTLCDIIKSLQSGNPNYIIGRRTLGSTIDPEVKILLSDGSCATFSTGKWSKVPPGGCTIFDQAYVRDNVHAGETVDIEHKRALFSLIVGERGVSLHKLVNNLEQERSDLNTPLKLAKQVVEASMPTGMKIGTILALKPDMKVDGKITDAEQVLAACK
jgi:wobble nucleotide-excising tRNase